MIRPGHLLDMREGEEEIKETPPGFCLGNWMKIENMGGEIIWRDV